MLSHNVYNDSATNATIFGLKKRGHVVAIIVTSQLGKLRLKTRRLLNQRWYSQPMLETGNVWLEQRQSLRGGETASEFPSSSPHNVRWHLGCKTASSVQDRGLRKAEVFTMQMQSIVLSLATVVGHRYSIIHYRYHQSHLTPLFVIC